MNTTNKEIAQNNEIIAVFMGRVIPEDKLEFYDENPTTHFYNSNWNWLMEVVEKIESLGYRVTIVRHICRIDLTEESKLIISEDIKKIEAVYSACLEFIKWYNKQNKV